MDTPTTEVPKRLSDVTKLGKTALNDLCRRHGIRLKNGKKAKINLLCLKLGLSTSGPNKENFKPRESENGLSQAQMAEFETLNPGTVESMGGWSKEVCPCPDLDEGKVKKYLLDKQVLSKDCATKYKISRPFQLKPMVHSMNFNPMMDSNHFCLLRARCNPSQSTSEDDVKSMYVIMDKILGIPYGGYCTCTAGFCQACGHMGAMLFCFADIASSGNHLLPADATCTEIPCQWSNPKGANVAPQILRDININVTKPSSTKTALAEYVKYLKENEPPLEYEEAMDFRASLMAATQSLGVFVPAVHALHSSRFNIHYSPPKVEELPNNAMELDARIVYSSEVTIETSGPQPLLYAFLHQQAIPDITCELQRQSLLEAMRTTRKERVEIEQVTRGQSENIIWYQQRMGALTSTQMCDVKKFVTTNCKISESRLISRCLGLRHKYITAPPRPKQPSLKWGSQNEGRAREMYQRWCSALEKHQNVQVAESGLLIHPVHPFIRASPDGLITCTCCETPRLLEIKCPYAARDVTPMQGIRRGSIDYIMQTDSGPKLSETKRGYYTQVQCTMAVAGVSLCDFVVWTPEAFIVIEVPYDESHWSSIQSAACTFYRDYIIPALVSRSPVPVEDEDNLGSDEDTTPKMPVKTQLAANQSPQSPLQIAGPSESTAISLVTEPPRSTAVLEQGARKRSDKIPKIEPSCAYPDIDDSPAYHCCTCQRVLPEEAYISEDNSDASLGCECHCGCDNWSCWLCANYTKDKEDEDITWCCPACMARCIVL